MAEHNTPPLPPVPVRERGYASSGLGGNWWTNSDDYEETPELRWPLSLAVSA